MIFSHSHPQHDKTYIWLSPYLLEKTWQQLKSRWFPLSLGTSFIDRIESTFFMKPPRHRECVFSGRNAAKKLALLGDTVSWRKVNSVLLCPVLPCDSTVNVY